MTDIKPIETVYNGYRFRSRLEARWAVFFDAMKIKYEYEPQGYKANDFEGKTYCYLPDFYFPESEYFGEVKSGLSALVNDAEKIAWCIDWKHTPISNGLILLGQIPYWSEDRIEVPIFPFLKWNKAVMFTSAFFGNRKIHVEETGIWDDYSEAPDLPPELFHQYPEEMYQLDMTTLTTVDGIVFEMDQNYKASHSYTLRNAFITARQARFEHGETPRI